MEEQERERRGKGKKVNGVLEQDRTRSTRSLVVVPRREPKKRERERERETSRDETKKRETSHKCPSIIS